MQITIVNGIFVAINGIIFLGTIVLNLLAIVYILTTRDKTTIAMLVVNLAVADIIHASGIIFFSSNLFTSSWVFGEFGCKFSLTVDVLCTVVIVYTVAALSIERYIDARSALTAKFRTLITCASLFLIWTLGLLVPFPFMFYTYLEISNTTSSKNSSRIPAPPSTMRSCESRLTETELFVHEIVLYVIAFIIPYSIIVIFSLKLLKFLHEWLKRKEKLTRTSVTRKRTRGVKLVLCIVLSFLVCYTPFWAFKFYTRYMVDDNVQQRPLLRRILSYVHSLVVLLNHFEGILNPLFFILLTERFCLTFSKHRQRRSRLCGPVSSAAVSNGGKKTSKTAALSMMTVKNTEMNCSLLLTSEPLEHNDDSPVVAQSL